MREAKVGQDEVSEGGVADSQSLFLVDTKDLLPPKHNSIELGHALGFIKIRLKIQILSFKNSNN